jgi:hypothetical protein
MALSYGKGILSGVEGLHVNVLRWVITLLRAARVTADD